MNNISAKGAYCIETFNANAIRDVERLHFAVYGKRPAKGYFAKKYDTAFAGATYTGFIAYDKEQHLPIAFYGVIPCFMQFNNKIVLAAQSADTMTHPEYRNKGLFVELAKLTFETCRNLGIQILFGFPNQNSLHGFVNKLGWQQKETMDCFVVRAGVVSWRRLFLKFSFLTPIVNRYHQKTLEKYLVPKTGLPNSVAEDGFASVYRDHHYLKYKTYSDTCVVKISRSFLWIKAGNDLVVGDILLEPGDFNEMMSKLKKLARKLLAKNIQFHISPGTSLHALFVSAYKGKPSFPVIFKELRTAGVDEIKFTLADIDIF